jgi:Cytochrome c554 and c-prime
MRCAARRNLQIIVALPFLAAIALSPRTQIAGQVPSTEWRPNQTTEARFVGSKACGECHRSKVASQQATPMGTALASPEDCQILRSNLNLTFRNGQYTYRISREANRSIYTVTDGSGTLSTPILYCFGNGEAGQTYLLHHKGKFYESRLSFYNDIRGLDFTMGHSSSPPATIQEAMGREMGAEETRNCFGCHSTNAVSGARLQLDHLMEGVSCEACHGPGDKHVAAMRAGDLRQKEIFNPKRLSTEDLSNFCGTCHRSWEQVALMGIRGVRNVRFQPFRLTNSKCYDSEDKRISCIACHDPHENRKRDEAFYDSKCQACHNSPTRATQPAQTQSSKRVAFACPVGKKNCASCHMPKYELPGSHFKFTDHHIRIVRPGEQYPN